MASSDITWMLVRSHNSKLVKRNGVSLSAERGNVRNLHAQRYSGLANRATIDLRLTKDKAGKKTSIAVTTKRSGARAAQRPAAQNVRTKLHTRNFRAGGNAVKQLASQRPELRYSALARYSKLVSIARGKKATAPRPKRRAAKRA